MSEVLREALKGQQFNSLEEALGFIDQITRQQNLHPPQEFHGLSPEQIHRILNFPFASPRLVRFRDVLDATPNAPILTRRDSAPLLHLARAGAFCRLSGTGDGGADIRRFSVSRVPSGIFAAAGPDR